MVFVLALFYVIAAALAGLVVNKCCSRTGGYRLCSQMAQCCGFGVILIVMYVGFIIIVSKLEEAYGSHAH